MNDSKVPGAPDKRTYVEEGTQFKGTMSSSCPVVVRGIVEGDVSAPSLVVSETGTVAGKVKVSELSSKGQIAGEFDADSIQLSGSVKDNTIIRAKSLEVRLSSDTGKMQVVFGEATLDVGEAPREPPPAQGGGGGNNRKKKGDAPDDGGGAG